MRQPHDTPSALVGFSDSILRVSDADVCGPIAVVFSPGF
jgi:hypothetical protein